MAPNSQVRAPSPIRHALVTGATGFVGQAVVERLLSHPQEPRIAVLVRSRPDKSAVARITDILNGPAFGPWRERYGDDAVEHALLHRLQILDGDLSHIPTLPSTLDLVVHTAASVKFDERIDRAFASNVEGPRNLYQALLDSGSTPHVIHVSTCYVHASRAERAPEGPVEHDVDWREAITWASQATDLTLHAASEQSRDSRWVTTTLSGLGRTRAREHGWTDVYTMTKTLGEDIAVELWHGAGHRLSIVRPGIIESAYAVPYPGWIDGFKVADPLIASYAKGRFHTFPGSPDAVLDVIPVDFVVSAIVATAEVGASPARPGYMHVGTGLSNPITLGQFTDVVHAFFTKNPWNRVHGGEVNPRPWKFVSLNSVYRSTAVLISALTALRWVLSAPVRPLRAWRNALSAHRRTLIKLRTYMTLYAPYTSSPTIYSDDGLRTVHGLVGSLADRSEVLYQQTDVTTIDWKHYLNQVHLPSLLRLMRLHDATLRAAAPAGGLPTVVATGLDDQATQVGPRRALRSPKSAGVASTR